MIIVDGRPVSTPNSPSPAIDLLSSLLENPTLTSASDRLKSTPERKLSVSEQPSSCPKHVYVFQREYATVVPALVELVGTDEATTCIGLVIRDRINGMTSVSHMDFPGVVDKGLTQMLQLFANQEAILDVHLVGGFDDTPKHVVHSNESGRHGRTEGYSLPLCCKLIEALQDSEKEFHLQTLCVLKHNTKTDIYGNARPIVGGFLVETSSGLTAPASFDRSSRCPDEIVRRIRVTVSSSDVCCKGRLLETYDTHSDRFQIGPVSWKSNWEEIAFALQQLTDSEILFKCSTSPLAEPPDFVENERRIWNYLINYPNWRQTFFGRKPRVFQRMSDSGWSRCA